MSKKKERFGRWVIKNYWIEILAVVVINLLILGYIWYIFSLVIWTYENNINGVITIALCLAPILVLIFLAGLSSAYGKFKLEVGGKSKEKIN